MKDSNKDEHRAAMRTLGLVGGTSWHSTIEYYRIINQATNEHFGNNTNPPLVLFNLNQAMVHKLQVEDNWDGVADLVTDGASRLVAAGTEAIMFCANTPHKIYESVKTRIEVPILHIADATAEAIQKKGLDCVGFIGTKFSMNENFVTGEIAKHGIRVLVPETDQQREELHRIIQQELTFGNVKPESKQYVTESIEAMIAQGARGIVLGCTEFPLMFSADDLSIPMFNTTEIHALAAVKFVLGDETL